MRQHPYPQGEWPALPKAAHGADLVMRALRRGPMTIALSMLVGLLVAGMLAVILPSKYTATVQLLTDPRGLQLVDREITARSQTTDAMLAVVESQARILTSDNLLQQVIETEKLADDLEFGEQGGGFGSALRSLFGRTSAPSQNRTLENFRKAVVAKRPERAYVIDLSVSSQSAEKSARLANAIAKTFLETEITARADAARRASGSLMSRLDELRQRVQEAEDKVETYKAKNNIVGAGGGRLVSEQQLSDLNSQLAQARARTADLKARFDQVEKLRKSGAATDATIEAVQSQSIAQLRQQYAELKRQESELLSTLGVRHPTLSPIREQIKGVQGLITEELSRLTRTMRAEYERAQANEDALSASLDSLKKDAVSTSHAFVRLRELERDVEASRAIYESFLKRAREIGEQEQIDTSNIRIISPAVIPSRPDVAKGPILLLAGLLLGAALGFGLAILQEMAAPAVAHLPPVMTPTLAPQTTNPYGYSLPIQVTTTPSQAPQWPARSNTPR